MLFYLFLKAVLINRCIYIFGTPIIGLTIQFVHIWTSSFTTMLYFRSHIAPPAGWIGIEHDNVIPRITGPLSPVNAPIWSKFGDPSLNGCWVIVRTSSWLTDTRMYTQTDRRTHTHTQATTIPEGQNWPRVKSIYKYFSCDQAALLKRPSIRLYVCSSAWHFFSTMFLSSYHHEIFRSYYNWQKILSM